MPHVIIEYSDNIDEWGNQETITRAVHDALCGVEHLPRESIKTRAIRHGQFHIGSDTAGKGFVTVLIRTRPGREDQALLEISEAARAAVVAHASPVSGKTLAVSVEVQMMNPVGVLHAKI